MGKYLHEFQSESDFQSFINSEDYIEPFVASTNIDGEWRMYYNQGYPEQEPSLTFVIQSDGNIYWNKGTQNKTIEYSKNDGEWTEIVSNVNGEITTAITTDEGTFTLAGRSPFFQLPMFSGAAGERYAKTDLVSVGNTVYSDEISAMMGGTGYTVLSVENTVVTAPSISVVSGDTVQFRGNNLGYAENYFSTTCSFSLKGDIMKMISGDTLPPSEPFKGMFKDCTGLTDASELVFPAETVVQSCYESMFQGCTNLTDSPVLPCTAVTSMKCYQYMFKGCTNLTGITCLAIDAQPEYSMLEWVDGVAAHGVFYRNPNMSTSMPLQQDSVNGIPAGWTVIPPIE